MHAQEKNKPEVSAILKQLKQEIKRAKIGSDEGIIPIYYLLNEFIQEKNLSTDLLHAAKACRLKVEALLDNNLNFDEFTLNFLAANVKLFNTLLGAEKDFSLNVPEKDFQAANNCKTGLKEEQNTLEDLDKLLDLSTQKDTDLLEEFFNEMSEHVEAIENLLLSSPHQSASKDAIDSLFRSFHTIKGGSGFMNFKAIKTLSHEVESLLDLIRLGKIAFCLEIKTLILKSHDTLVLFLEQINTFIKQHTLPDKIIPISSLIKKIRQTTEQLLKNPSLPSEQKEPSSVRKERAKGTPLPSEAISSINKSEEEEKSIPQEQQEKQSIRVDTYKIDKQLDTVAELLLLEKQIRKTRLNANGSTDVFLASLHEKLKTLSSHLYKESLSLRMIPIKSSFQKINRLVYELSHSIGKNVRLHIEGENTELDKSLIESVSAPLVHLARNSIDHGIEKAEERQRLNKPLTGNCYLKAYQQNEHIIIEFSDDGRGIDVEKVIEKAKKEKLIPQSASPSPQEAYQLLFLPGFSTSKQLTEVSGRGVGLDIVCQNIKKLRGQINVTSSKGKGTKFQIAIPLTLAIIDGLLVKVGKEQYIIPSYAVKLAFRPLAKQIKTEQNRTYAHTDNKQKLPIVSLGSVFKAHNWQKEWQKGVIIVVSLSGKEYGLFVDKILQKQEVILKNLGPFYSNITGIASAALTGDKKITLVLDLLSLANAFLQNPIQ